MHLLWERMLRNLPLIPGWESRTLIFRVSHDDSFSLVFFSYSWERNTGRILYGLILRCPLFFPPSSSFSWFTARFVHNLMDVPLSVRCRFLVSSPFYFVFLNNIQFNEQRTTGLSPEGVASWTAVHLNMKLFEEKPHPESSFDRTSVDTICGSFIVENMNKNTEHTFFCLVFFVGLTTVG